MRTLFNAKCGMAATLIWRDHLGHLPFAVRYQIVCNECRLTLASQIVVTDNRRHRCLDHHLRTSSTRTICELILRCASLVRRRVKQLHISNTERSTSEWFETLYRHLERLVWFGGMRLRSSPGESRP
jgi:hypothetical protein